MPRQRVAAAIVCLVIGLVSFGPEGRTEGEETTPAAALSPEPAEAADPVAAAVRERLAARRPGAAKDDAAALAAFYAEHKGPPLWVMAGGLSARGSAVAAEMRKAEEWGLAAKDFELPRLAEGEQAAPALAEAEVTIGLAVLEYARHSRGGRTDPSALSRYIDRKPPLREPRTVLTEIAAANAPDAYLRDLHPKHAQFQRLRRVLLKQGMASGADATERPVVALPDGPQLKPGVRHPHVALLRRRLAVAAAGGEPDVYDEDLAAAVRAFQSEHGLKPSGLLTPRTRSALNGPPRPRRDADAQLILLNMERWRWMPEDLGELHVLDNIPEFTMRVVKNGETVHQEKMVVGKLETQTPIFSADMKEVIFHPDWGVPDSIKVNELWPSLRRSSGGFFGYGGADTRVLERHNLRVSYNGRPVDASMVDWNSVDIRRFTFIQPAGAGNVLGVLKFRFPNRHDVYMHDTPQRELFSQSRRTFSHGCMRVQNPRQLAEVLLGEDQGMSAAQVGNLLARGQQTDVQLRRKIPVHVAYFTAVVDERGRLETFPDVYGHDRRLAAALEGRPLPLIEPREEVADTYAPPQRDPRRAGRSRRDTGDPLTNAISGLFAN